MGKNPITKQQQIMQSIESIRQSINAKIDINGESINISESDPLRTYADKIATIANGQSQDNLYKIVIGGNDNGNS